MSLPTRATSFCSTSSSVARPLGRARRPLRVAAIESRWADAAASTAVSLAAAAALLASPVPAHATVEAAAVFERTCAGCHSGGGNIIRRDATLQMDDLKKFGMADTTGLYTIIYGGKGSMPGYGVNCAPRGACTFGPRLPDEDIAALADFVLSSAQNGWQKPIP